MDFGDAVAAIKSRLTTQWAALGHSAVTIVWPNDPVPTIDPPASVIHAAVTGGPERVAAFGGPNQNRYRQFGELIIRILVPSDSGADAARNLADDAATIFRGWRSGDLMFFGVGNSAGSNFDRDGDWFEVDVICPFTNDLIA